MLDRIPMHSATTHIKAYNMGMRLLLLCVNDMIYDKNGKPYTNRDELLRRLYVACSRASHELVLCYGN